MKKGKKKIVPLSFYVCANNPRITCTNQRKFSIVSRLKMKPKLSRDFVMLQRVGYLMCILLIPLLSLKRQDIQT